MRHTTNSWEPAAWKPVALDASPVDRAGFAGYLSDESSRCHRETEYSNETYPLDDGSLLSDTSLRKLDSFRYHEAEHLARGEDVTEHQFLPDILHSRHSTGFQCQSQLGSLEDWNSHAENHSNLSENGLLCTDSVNRYEESSYTNSNSSIENINSSHFFSVQQHEQIEANHSDDFSADIEDTEFLEAVLAQTEFHSATFGKPVDSAPLTDMTNGANEELVLYESAETIVQENEEYLTQDSDEFPLDGDITLSQLISAEETDETVYDDDFPPCIEEALFSNGFQDAYAADSVQHHKPRYDPTFEQYTTGIKYDAISEGDTSFSSNNVSNAPIASCDSSAMETSTSLETDGSGAAVQGRLPNYRHPFTGASKTENTRSLTPQSEAWKPPQPFLRPPFPLPVANGSLVQGLTSSHTILRTCFRIGEALKVHLTRHTSSPQCSFVTKNLTEEGNQTASVLPRIPSTAIVLIELYAFVTESYRIEDKQFFKFADLFFPFNPPYLSGVWGCWEGNSLYNEDGKRFLGLDGRPWRRSSDAPPSRLVDAKFTDNFSDINGEGAAGRLCRLMGIFKPENRPLQPKLDESLSGSALPSMAIYNIWRATWEDVNYVKGIVED